MSTPRNWRRGTVYTLDLDGGAQIITRELDDGWEWFILDGEGMGVVHSWSPTMTSAKKAATSWAKRRGWT